ncbi:MAG TPA: MFS transporter [Candidatus Limnocylindria bacterium]
MPTGRAVALVTAAALLGDTLLYTALPVNAARLGLDALAIGLILSLNRWVRLVTNPFAARLYERLPAGGLIFVALALAVASTAAYALPAALALFLAARLVWGMAWSLLRLGSLLSAIEGAGGRAGRALGDMRAVYGLGYLGGAVYAPFAVESFGWGAAALGAAALTLLLGIGPALTVADWRREVDVNEREEAAIRRSLVDPRFIGLFVVAAVQYALWSGVVPIAGGLRIAEIFGGGALVLAIPLAATIVAGLFILGQRLSNVLWTPVAGRLADRALAPTFVASTLGASGASLLLALTHDATAFVAIGALAFFSGITSTVALELSIAHRTTAGDRPRILGAYNTWADAGAAIGALSAGFIALAGTHVPFVTAAVLTVATLAWAPAIRTRALTVGASAR